MASLGTFFHFAEIASAAVTGLTVAVWCSRIVALPLHRVPLDLPWLLYAIPAGCWLLSYLANRITLPGDAIVEFTERIRRAETIAFWVAFLFGFATGAIAAFV
ncbi:MAG: hypothetical protein WC712_12410 [Candidatus Brocadiia bacterium]